MPVFCVFFFSFMILLIRFCTYWLLEKWYSYRVEYRLTLHLFSTLHDYVQCSSSCRSKETEKQLMCLVDYSRGDPINMNDCSRGHPINMNDYSRAHPIIMNDYSRHNLSTWLTTVGTTYHHEWLQSAQPINMNDYSRHNLSTWLTTVGTTYQHEWLQ